MVDEEYYTVEVSGTFNVFAESQEQANEYIEQKLYEDRGAMSWIGSLEIHGDE